MAGGALGVDIDGTGRPVWGSLAAVATDVGAGGAAKAGCAATLIIKIGQNANIGGAVVMGCAIMAGSTGRVYRTETNNGVIGMRPLPVGSRGARGRLTMTCGTARVHGLNVCSVAGGAIPWGRLAGRQADQAAGSGVMTAGAGVVGLVRNADQGVVVAVGAAGGADGNDGGVVGGRGVRRRPGAGMAGGTVAGG